MEVLAKTFENEALARMWAEVLENHGIRTLVRQVRGSFPLPYHGPFVPHGLYVMPEDADRARELLNEQGETAGPA